jgi:hypothetical protein
MGNSHATLWSQKAMATGAKAPDHILTLAVLHAKEPGEEEDFLLTDPVL